MTLTETRNFMERIKFYYQEFVIDNPKVEEWHKQLKDYNNQEVNDKFEEHLKSEEYGHQIPRIGFLTKYLIKESEKPLNNANTIRVKCSQCGKGMPLTEFDKHMERCNSVEYLNFISQKLYNKELDKEKYRNMDDETFDKIYNKVANEVLKVSEDEEEKERLIKYLLGVNYEEKL